MTPNVEELCETAKDLPDIQKLALVDALLTQLHRPDSEVDRSWIEEVRSRRQAHREGQLQTRDYCDIIETFRHSWKPDSWPQPSRKCGTRSTGTKTNPQGRHE